MLLNYALGHRVFEIDFSLTSDNASVLVHEADLSHTTADEFLSVQVAGEFHPMSLDALIDFLFAHPDVYIVTDTKYVDEERTERILSQIVAAAIPVHPDILDQFIIQIYRPEMFDWIMAVHPWKSVIYTLYNDPNWTPENVLEFASLTGVKLICMWDSWVTPEITALWLPAGLNIAAHTVNNLVEVKELQSLGVQNIYTDFLLP